MPYTEITYHKDVTHIGHLSGTEGRCQSLDGPGISVSTHPDSWRQIKGLNGPEYVFRYPPAQWVDAMKYSDQDLAEMLDWAIQNRYLRQVKAFFAMVPQGGDTLPAYFEKKIDAARALEMNEEDPEFDMAVTEEDTFRITPKGLKALERWPGPFIQWEQAVILLYVRKVLVVKRPWVVGVWWSEPDQVNAGVAPSGILFPERLHLFEVEDEEGEVADFKEMFPDLSVPEDPYVAPDL